MNNDKKRCPHCASSVLTIAGKSRLGDPKFRCETCKRLFQEGVKHRPLWTPEEDELLLKLGQCPNLESLWNAHAKINKWPQRTKAGLIARLGRLQASRYEQENGWMTRSQLLKALGLSESSAFCFSNWVANGLPIHKEENGYHRVFLGDFVRWCLSPEGIDIASKFLSKNKSVANWFLNAIAQWQNEPNPLRVKSQKAKKHC